MTVLTFPSNPTVGQQYAAPNGIQYVFDGVKWIVETTSSSSEAVSNSTQDRVAPMFVDGDNTGITFTYNATTNVMSATVTSVNGNQLVNGDKTLVLGSDGILTLPDFGAFTSPNYGFSFNKNSEKTGAPELGTDVTFATENLNSDILDSEVYMGSGYGEFRSIYNKVDSTESGLAYAGVEGFNYAQYGDVNFAGMVSQTPNIDSMYAVGLNEMGQIVIGFTQNGQTQQSNNWSVAVGTLNTDMTVNGLFANTNTTVIGSGLSVWQFGTDGNLTLPDGGIIKNYDGSQYGGAGLFQSDTKTWITSVSTGRQDSRIMSVSSVEYDATGNILALALVANFDGGVYPGTSTNALIKLDPNGQLIWQYDLNDSSFSFATQGWGIAQDSVGNIYITGIYEDSTLMVVKLDSDASPVWTKTYSGYDNLNGLVVDVGEDDHPVIVGQVTLPQPQGVESLILKLDGTDGTIMWAKSLGGYDDDMTGGMAVSRNDNSVVVVGTITRTGTGAITAFDVSPTTNSNWTQNLTDYNIGSGSTVSIEFSAGVPTITIGGNNTLRDVGNQFTIYGSLIGGTDNVDNLTITVTATDGNSDNHSMVAKYNSTGDLQWQKALSIELTYDAGGSDADIDSDGNVYVLGYGNWAGGSGIVISKFDSTGQAQWTRTVQGDCTYVSGSIVVGDDDLLYISTTAGNEISGPDGATGGGAEQANTYLAKYNKSGIVQWQRELSKTNWYVSTGVWMGPNLPSGSNLDVKNGYIVSGNSLVPNLYYAAVQNNGYNNFVRTVVGQTEGVITQLPSTGEAIDIGAYSFAPSKLPGIIKTAQVADAELTETTLVDLVDATTTFATTELNLEYGKSSAGSGSVTGDITFDGKVIYNQTGITMSTVRGSLNFGHNLEAPGQATHFHVNGTETANIDYFFGDDYNYLKLNSGNFGHGVTIGANDNDGGGQQLWTFGTDGSLALPGNITSTTDASIVVGNTYSPITNVSIWTVDYSAPVWRIFVIAGIAPNLGIDVQAGDTVTTSWGTPVTATIQEVIDDRAGGGFWVFTVDQNVLTGFAGGSTATFISVPTTWTFGTDGSLTLPALGVIKDSTGTNILDGLGGGSSSVTTGDTAPVDPNLGDLWYDTNSGRTYIYYDTSWVDSNPASVVIPSSLVSANGGSYTISVDEFGRLIVPDNGFEIYTPSAGEGNKNIDLYTNGWEGNGVEVFLMHNTGVGIYTDNGAHGWVFDSTGGTTFPTLTVSLNDNTNPSGSGQVLKFAASDAQAIIYGPAATASYPSAQRTIIQGAPGYTGTSGEGGDIYLWAGAGGDSNGNGGDIKVRAGRGQGTAEGGYLRFQGGDSSTGPGGFIQIESGQSSVYGQGGDINVWAQDGGDITLRTHNNITSQNWLFGADGNVTLPGDINTEAIGFRFNQTITNIYVVGSDVFVTMNTSVFGGAFSGYVKISNVTGTTEANGIWWAQATDPDEFTLYLPNSHTERAIGNAWGAYISGGTALHASSKDFNVNVGVNTWTFGTDNVTLPNGSEIVDESSTPNTAFPGLPAGMAVNVAGNKWKFASEGSFELPGAHNMFGDQLNLLSQESYWASLTTTGTQASMDPADVANSNLGSLSGVGSVWRFSKTQIDNVEYNLDLIVLGTTQLAVDAHLIDSGTTPGTNIYGITIVLSMQDPDDANIWVIGTGMQGSLAYPAETTVYFPSSPAITTVNGWLAISNDRKLATPGQPLKINTNYANGDWVFTSIATLSLPNFGSVPGSGDGEVGDICRNGDTLYFKTSAGWATIGLTLI